MKNTLDKKIKKGTLTRRDFLKVAGIGTIGLYAKCSSTKPPDDPPIITKEMLRASLNAEYIVFGQGASVQQNAPGTVNYTSTDGAVNKTANIGQQIDLIEVDQGTSKAFNITVQGDDALKRIYNNVLLSGTTAINGVTLLKDAAGFGIDSFVNQFLAQCGGRNMTWEPDTITCYIDPILSSSHITAIENAIKEVAGYGGLSVAPFIDERKPYDATTPPDGEIWIYYEPTNNGLTNYSYGDDTVKSAKMMIKNPITGQLRGETFDMFIKNNQNVFWDQYIAKHFEFALKQRPQGNQNSYRVYTDREEQEGFDSSTNIQGLPGLIKTYMKKDIAQPPGVIGNVFNRGESEYILIETKEGSSSQDTISKQTIRKEREIKK
ncbi:hypothetical protein ACFLRX_09385 [Acidobacteriota bacterium]